MQSERVRIQVPGRRLACAVILLAALAVLGGCVRANVLSTDAARLQRPMTEPPPKAQLPIPLDKDPTKIYRIGARDEIRVDVRKDPTLNNIYIVTEEGYILLPNGIGPVQVANLTTTEIEAKLNEVLSEYIREPEARVGVQRYQSKVVYVFGQVFHPGPQIMKADQLTLQDAIFMAGLPTDSAAIQRTRVITPALNKPIVRQINLTEILYEGKLEKNILLQPGDYVYVPAKYSANFAGALRDLLAPVDEIYSIQYRATFGRYGNNNNNN